MNSNKKLARKAGLLYLIMGITSGFGIMYVPLNILVVGDAFETAKNIIDSEMVYRLSMVSNLIGQAVFIFLVLTLYRLFKEVDSKYAQLMVVLVAVAVPITFLNTLNLVAAQVLVSGTNYLNVFDTGQLNAFALLFLNLYDHGVIVVQVFWGLWLLPFGLLVYKSGFIPKILGILLIIGCFAYLVESFNGLLFPDYKEIVSIVLVLPLAVSEFSIILWLLIKGVRDQPLVKLEDD